MLPPPPLSGPVRSLSATQAGSCMPAFPGAWICPFCLHSGGPGLRATVPECPLPRAFCSPRPAQESLGALAEPLVVAPA